MQNKSQLRSLASSATCIRVDMAIKVGGAGGGPGLWFENKQLKF